MSCQQNSTKRLASSYSDSSRAHRLPDASPVKITAAACNPCCAWGRSASSYRAFLTYSRICQASMKVATPHFRK